MRISHLIIAIGFTICSTIPSTASQDLHAQGRFLSIQVQNDAISGTDENYTSGIEAVWTKWVRRSGAPLGEYFSQDPASPPARGTLSRSGLFSTELRSFAVGQKIFTPSDLSRSGYIPTDRPYAGWSYLRISHEQASINKRRKVALEAGTFGPRSYASDLQRSFHSLIRSEDPRGWAHQIENEAAVDLILERESRLFSRQASKDYQFTLSNCEQLTLGTANTNLKLGLIANLNRGLSWANKSSMRYFSRATLTMVGRDRSLSGTLANIQERVRKSSAYYEFEFGMEYQLRAGRLAFSLTKRGRQFEEQAGSHTFGTLRYTLW